MCTHMPCVPGVIEYKTAYIMQVGLSISHQLSRQPVGGLRVGGRRHHLAGQPAGKLLRVRVELVRSVGLDWDHELIRRRGHLREEERVLQKHASEGP